MLPHNSEFGSPSIFGISHNPGYNQNSSTGRSIFGGTSSGVFGASSSSTSSTTFGSPMPAFTGSSTFGLASTGSSIFWQKPIFDTSSSGFGFTSSSPSFGQPTMSAFSSSFPGTIQSPFQPQTSLSGCQVSIPTGWSTGYQQPISAENHGSRVAPYRETVVGGEIPLSISAMPFYSDKSHEELRWEDKGSSILGTQKPTFGSGFCFTSSSPSLGQPTMSAFSGSFFQQPTGYQVWSPGFGFGPGKELASRAVNVPCSCQTAVDSEKPLSVSAMPLSHEELRWEHYKGGSRIGTAIPKPFSPLTPPRTPAFAFQNLSPFSSLFVQSTNSSIIQPKPANMFLSATSASSENLFWTTPSLSYSHSSTSSSPSICCSNFITSTTSPAVVVSSPTESGTKNTNNTSSLFPSTSSASCLPPLPQPSPLFTSLPPFTTLQPSTTAPFLPTKPNLVIASPFTGSTFEKSSCIPSQISTTTLATTSLSPPFQPAQTAETSGKNSTEACVPVSNVAIHEEKEGEKFTGKARTIDDATSPYHKHSAVDVKELMPKLHKSPEYYTEPEIQDLESMERVEPGSITRVKDFVIGRHGHGSIKFLGPTGVCQLDLESLIQFNDREVIVYADENKKHAIGQGINKAAEVTLLNIKCFDKRTGKQCVDGRNVVKYREMLIKTTADRGAEFVSYDPVKGEWKFKVHHFV